jgi:aspartate kinase
MTRRALVLRFSGSSLDTPLRMRSAAERIREHLLSGTAVAVVVGPSVHRTSRVFAWLERLRASRPAAVARELDRGVAGAEQTTAALLAATLAGAGVDAVSLGASEAGLNGDGDCGEAVLSSLDARRVGELLAGGTVVVLAGGHVQRPDGELVSLGRTGADVTAVALADALGADCHFIVDRRRLELSKEGEPLIHPEALRRAHEGNVPIRTYSFRRASLDPDSMVDSP